MSTNTLDTLNAELRLARRNLAEDAPFSPAWAATTEWVDDLEREVHELATTLGILVSAARLERLRVA